MAASVVSPLGLAGGGTARRRGGIAPVAQESTPADAADVIPGPAHHVVRPGGALGETGGHEFKIEAGDISNRMPCLRV